MALEKFYVITNIQRGPSSPFGEGRTEFSKTEAEELAGAGTTTPPNVKYERYGKEPITIQGGIKRCDIVTIESEAATGAAKAAKFVKYAMGLPVYGVLAPWAGKTALTEVPATSKEEAEKPVDTVKTSAIEATAAV